ncbi:MAG: Na+/H+ antiporter subunit E, partial [Halioglobus sp.]|nr:Na+/H+ antiporter subunit E [Halioglobus sp.]
WLLWSGIYKPLLLGLGALSCLLTCYIARRMDYFDRDFFMLHFSARLLVYLAWLAKEVVRSSLEVSRIVLDPRLPISPTVLDLDARALHPIDRAILGNSITLTPGTLALDVHRGVVKVHCLTRDGADALMSSGMERRVAALRRA